MSIPTNLPEWDKNEVNIVEVDTQHKEEGWLAPAGVPEKPPFQSFNWWQNLVYKWIKYFKEFSVVHVTNVAALSLISSPVTGDSVIVKGYTTEGDGGGGIFNYDSSQSAVNNGGTIIDGWIRQKTGAITLRDFGAKGDGTTDDTTTVQNALDTISNIEGTYGDTYLITAALVKTDFCIIDMKGAIFDFSTIPVTTVIDYFTIKGSEDAEILLTADALHFSNTVEITDASSFSHGDNFRLGSDDLYDASSTFQDIGEILTVDSVSGNIITTIEPLQNLYLVADNAVVSKINMLDNVIIENLSIFGAGHSGADRTQHGLVMDKCKNPQIRNVHVDNVDRIGIQIKDCIDFSVEECSASNAYSTNSGYGISILDACQDGVVSGFRTKNTRHSTSTNNTTAVHGITRRIKHIGCVALNTINSGDAFDTHTAAEEISYEDCHVLSSSSQGFNIECRSASIINCTTRNTAANGISAHNESDYDGTISIINCKVYNSGNNGVNIQAPTRGSVATYTKVILDNIMVEIAVTQGILIQSGTLNSPENISISNIIINGSESTTAALYLLEVKKAVVANITINTEITGNSGLRVQDSENVAINNITVELPASGNTNCIYINSTGADLVNGVAIDNITVISPSDVSSDGILISSDTKNVIVGDTVNLSDCNNDITAASLSVDSFIGRHETFQTIDTGAINFNSNATEMTTEGAAATDDLETINGGRAGDMITLTADDPSRVITVVTGSGNIRMNSNFVIDDTRDSLTLVNNGGFWIEVARASYN